VKKNTVQGLALLGAAGAAAYLALRTGAAQAGEGSGEGSLGGEDSFTSEGNPFAGIDPNSQPTNYNYYLLGEQLADDTIIGDDPNAPSYDDGGSSEGPPPPPTEPGQGGGDDFFSGGSGYNPWAESLIWGAGLVAGGAAASGLGRLFTGTKDVPTSGAKVKDASVVTKDPMSKLQEDLGFRPGDGKAEIARGRSVTESAYKEGLKFEVKDVGGAKVRDVALKTEFKPGSNVKAKTTAGKVTEGAGLALAYAQVGSEVVQEWRDYNPSNVKEAAGVVAKGATDWGQGAFAFLSGIVYRPEGKSAEAQAQKNTGWFATFQDLYDLGQRHKEKDTPILRRLGDVLGVSGYFPEDDKKDASVEMQTKSMSVSTPMYSAVQQQSRSVSTGYSVAPSPTQPTVKPASRSSSGGGGGRSTPISQASRSSIGGLKAGTYSSGGNTIKVSKVSSIKPASSSKPKKTYRQNNPFI